MDVTRHQNYRVLIVDDDPINVKLLRLTLEAEGYTVMEAKDGQEALAKLDSEACDLVVSDILMPNMDGYRLCYEIRHHPRLRSVPLMFYTATFTSPSDEELATSVGADKYLRKPAPRTEILQSVEELAGKESPAQASHRIQPAAPEFAQRYSEVLIRKLEDKNQELSDRTHALEQSERELKRSHQQLRVMAANLESAREKEALRISREIHDELAQSLTALSIDIICLQNEMPRGFESESKQAIEKRLDAMSKLVGETTRSVQRIASDLRPPILDDLGLSLTLEWQAQEFAARTGIECVWNERVETKNLDKKKATAMFRIFREILTNVARHAKATRVEMILAVRDRRLMLEVSDNGVGFDIARSEDRESIGLLGMRERALILDGEVSLLSAPGHGATVRAEFPLREGEP